MSNNLIADSELSSNACSLTDKELKLTLDKAKISLMQKREAAFITTILFHLQIEWEESEEGKIYTTYEKIVINKNYWANLSEQDRVYYLMKEAWHVAMLHVVNINNEGIDRAKYQKASDYVVNDAIKASDFELPSNALYKDKYSGLSTEEVYQILELEEGDDSNNKGNGNDRNSQLPNDINHNHHPDNNNNNNNNNNSNSSQSSTQPSPSKEDIEQQIKNMLASAATQTKMSKQAGSLPGEIEQIIEEAFNPKLPWNVILQNLMSSFSKDDYSYAKPNRRFLPEFYLPSLHSEGIGKIAAARDTSGSVSDEELALFTAENSKIKEMLNPETFTLVDFDTSIRSVHKVNRDQQLQHHKVCGRGGTDLKPVFEYFNKPENKPEALIVFSDLCCSAITEDPGYPVFWVCINNSNAEVNFGQLIHTTTDEMENY